MLLNRHQVIYNRGNQTVRGIPRHNGEVRVATSPTYAIYDYREGETSSDREIVAAGTAATVGTETETLAAAAGPNTSNPHLLQVADESDFDEGYVYLIHEAGEREAFTVDRLDSSNHYIYTHEQLRKSWTTNATIVAVEMTGTFPTAEAADEDEVENGGGPYGIVWSYTVDGEVHQDFQPLWLSRYSFVSLIDETDIKRADPKLAAVLRAPYSLSDLCILATEEYCADVAAAGKDPALFWPSNRRIAVLHKAMEIAYRWKGKAEDREMADLHREDYLRIVGSILTGIPPHGTVEVSRTLDTAPAGTSENYTPGILRRS